MKRRICYALLAIVMATSAASLNSNKDMLQAAEGSITESQKSLGDFLGQCPKSFFDNVPVDEAFILWIEKQYGKELLDSIVSEVSGGNTAAEVWYAKTGSSIKVLWTEYCKAKGCMSEGVLKVKNKDNDDDRITIDFIGDINFDENWGTMAAVKEKDNGIEELISESVRQELKSADFTVINNEFTYNKNGIALDGKDYTFAAYEESVKYLDTFSPDLVNLANNHVYDFGEEGLHDTLVTLTNKGYEYIGAGNNIKEASEIKYYIVSGRKLAFVSATLIEKYSNYTKAATQTEGGVFKIDDTDYVNQVIKKAATNSDYVIVITHWGNEGDVKYEAQQEQLAESFVNSGADAVIGGHPHRLQGATYINNAPVLYSLGNFWFCDSKLYSTIAQINIDESGKLSVRMIPCIMDDYCTDIITESGSYDDFYRYVSDVSTGIGFDADGNMYNKSLGEVDSNGNALCYSSEQSYRRHAGGFDLIGRKIDIVGNLN